MSAVLTPALTLDWPDPIVAIPFDTKYRMASFSFKWSNKFPSLGAGLSSARINFNLQFQQSGSPFTRIRGVYIDNTESPMTLMFGTNDTNMRVPAPPYSMVMAPIFSNLILFTLIGITNFPVNVKDQTTTFFVTDKELPPHFIYPVPLIVPVANTGNLFP